jgi:hypothetical protein
MTPTARDAGGRRPYTAEFKRQKLARGERRCAPSAWLDDDCRRSDADPTSPRCGAHISVERRGDCMTLDGQLALLFILPIPIASIAGAVTHEEVFRKPREWCAAKRTSCQRLSSCTFFYLFTCEYCFSHYVTAFSCSLHDPRSCSMTGEVISSPGSRWYRWPTSI